MRRPTARTATIVLRLAFATAAATQGVAGRAAIVECTDARGVSILSTSSDGTRCAATNRPAPRTVRASTTSPSPASFPRVDAATQRSRDSDRALILKDELDREQRRLVATESRMRMRPATASGSASPGDPDTTELVALLARTRENIRAIQVELAGVR